MVAVPLAGCIELEDLVSSTSEALPAAPMELATTAAALPLQVPQTRLGELATFEGEHEGYILQHGHGNDTGGAQPYKSKRTETREVVATTQTDAWLRPVESIEYRYAGVSHDNFHHGHDWSIRDVYETATGLSILSEMGFSASDSDPHCGETNCSPEKFSSTVYPRQRDEAAWAELAGRELHIGDEIHFEKTLGMSSIRYLVTIDYTVLREEILDGERTFVVSMKTDYQLLHPDGDSIHHDHETASDDAPSVPDPVHFAWYSERASVPVQESGQYWFRFEGQLYGSRSTSRLSDYEPGTQPIPWGEGEPVPPLVQVPEDQSTPFGRYVNQNSWGAYPLSEAWGRVEQDPLLLKYGSWKANHPDGVLSSVGFVAEPEETTRSWVFQAYDFDSRTGVDVVSRMSYPTPLDQATYENRDYGTPRHFGLDEQDVPSPTTSLLDVDEAVRMYQATVQGADSEPAILIRFVPQYGYWNDVGPTIVLGPAQEQVDSDGPMAGVYVGYIDSPITIDLVDGGLRSINGDFAHLSVIWSRLPISSVGLENTEGPGDVPMRLRELKGALPR